MSSVRLCKIERRSSQLICLLTQITTLVQLHTYPPLEGPLLTHCERRRGICRVLTLPLPWIDFFVVFQKERRIMRPQHAFFMDRMKAQQTRLRIYISNKPRATSFPTKPLALKMNSSLAVLLLESGQ